MTSPRVSFRLRGPVSGSPAYSFSIPARYAEGDVLTAGEAQALSQLMAENVQNNMRAKFLSELAGCMPGELLSQAQLADLQLAIETYAEKYVFLERHEPKPRLGAFEAEALAIATELVEIEARKAGRELAEAERAEAIAQAQKLDWVQSEARARVQARAEVAASAVEELL